MLHMTLPACTVLEPESLVPITASKVAGLLPLQVALDGQHYETVGNLLDADRGLRLYKPPAIRDISPHIVPATGRTVLALSSSEACFTVGPAALERVPRDDDDGCALFYFIYIRTPAQAHTIFSHALSLCLGFYALQRL